MQGVSPINQLTPSAAEPSQTYLHMLLMEVQN